MAHQPAPTRRAGGHARHRYSSTNTPTRSSFLLRLTLTAYLFTCAVFSTTYESCSELTRILRGFEAACVRIMPRFLDFLATIHVILLILVLPTQVNTSRQQGGKHDHDRLCWLSQKRAEKQSCTECLKA
jgi:hypothetical protein